MRVDVPLFVTEVGANVVVTNEGKPEMLKFTTPAKLFTDPIVTVSVPVELRFTVIVGFVTEMVKSAAGTASTFRVTETVRVSVPSDPVIVSG